LIFGTHEKITKRENVVVTEIRKRRLDPCQFGQIQSDQWPDPIRSSRILTILAGSDRFLTIAGFRPYSARIWSTGIRHPALFRCLDDAGFPCRLISDDRLLSDLSSHISNDRAMTNNIISENNLRFLKP